MRNVSSLWALALLACLSLASVTLAEVVHTKTYFSRAYELASGDVVQRYDALEMPEGHVGLRDFDAEVVDEDGNSVPLYEVYLHHWKVVKYYVKKGHKELVSSTPENLTDPTMVFNMYEGHAHRMLFQEGADVKQETREGTCAEEDGMGYFAVGAETRHSDLSIPSPYALETGNPARVPEGYEEVWYLNVHTIDTRGAIDATSCLECLCEAYGVTTDSQGRFLQPGYRGGMHCCSDKTHCAVKKDAALPSRKLHLKYHLTWVEWDETVIPVRWYNLDAFDTRTSLDEKPNCKTEYEVPECNKESNRPCIDRRYTIGALPVGGDLIKVQMHQHPGGLGGVLYDKIGNVLCESKPIYGKGHKAGDEAGYLVGMTACFPKPGSIYLADWVEINFEAFYSAGQTRTGVMSIFKVYVADPVTDIQEVTNKVCLASRRHAKVGSISIWTVIIIVASMMQAPLQY